MDMYDVTISVCTTVCVEADSMEEAIRKVAENYEEGKQDLIDAIELNGCEIEIDE